MNDFANRKTACPRLFAESFIFGGECGSGDISADISGVASSSLIIRAFRIFFSILLWFSFWLLPSQALAEWGTNDSNKLNAILVELQTIESHIDWTDVNEIHLDMMSIKNNVDSIDDNLSTAKNNLAYILHNLGYGVASSQTGTISQDFSDVKLKLDAIITALQNLENSGSGGSGSGSTDINQDWVKQTTFQDYSDNFQTYYDWMRASLGFDGGSSGSLKDYLTPYYNLFSDERYEVSLDVKILDNGRGANTVPYPNNTNKWADTEHVITEKFMVKNPYEYIVAGVNRGLFNLDYDLMLNLKKQSWNDWQAHTNLVSTLERLLDNTPPSNNVSSQSDLGSIESSENGQEVLKITYDKGTGDSSEDILLTPAFTNNVAQLSTDANTITNDFNDIWNYSKIRERYIDESKITTSLSGYDVQQKEVSDFTIQYGTKSYMNYKWTNVSLRMYKAIFTYERMKLLRNIFGRMWNVLVIWGCYVLFRILGKANS